MLIIQFSDCLLITKSDADSEEPISQFLVWNLSDIDVFEDDHLEREDQFKIQNNDSSQVLTFAVRFPLQTIHGFYSNLGLCFSNSV